MTEFFQTTHAAEALFDRYGIGSNNAIWRQALIDVTSRPRASLLLQIQPRNTTETHAVWMDSGDGTRIAVRVVYCPEMAMFLTALPPTETPRRRRHIV
jgi:hypothetical protein